MSTANSNLQRASRTAELMAVQRGLESRHPPDRRLFIDPVAAAFVSRHWRLALALARVGAMRMLLEWLYDLRGGPGPRASAVARTQLIDDALRSLVDSAQQVVILGAGYDTRAFRLQSLSGCTVFEVDHPYTQARKRGQLDKLQISPFARVLYVPVDFERDDLAVALRDAGYQAEAPSLFVWEGVTNYLSAGAVDSTLAAIRQLTVPPSYLVFTYVDEAALAADGAETFPEARRWLAGVRRRGEPWTFGFNPADLATYLDNRGFTLISDLTAAQAGERYFPSHGRRERGSRLYHIATTQRFDRAVAPGGQRQHESQPDRR